MVLRTELSADASPAGAASTPVTAAAARVNAARIAPPPSFANYGYSLSTSLFGAQTFRNDQRDSCGINGRGPALVHPARHSVHRRLRGSFPAGYEISEIQGAASPAKYWGLQPDWSSDPRQCAALADPAKGSATSEGLSGSGSGGIIYVVVAASPSASGPDPGTVTACDHWSMDSGRTTAVINVVDSPVIGGVPTVGMVAMVRTIVEGGTETDLRATTTIAYLGD